MPKISYEKEKCIGCGTCAVVCSEHWEMKEDGFSELKGGEKNEDTGNMEKEVKDAECNKEASQSCPAQCIHVE